MVIDRSNKRDVACDVQSGKGGTVAAGIDESQSSMAMEEKRCLTGNYLLSKVCSRSNLNRAYKRVKSNKGAAGIDRLTVDEMLGYLKRHKEEIVQSLLDGTYEPQAVREVEIPKPKGGKRKLGIPTVVDRLIQQSIAQVLEPIFEPGFSDSSYGFRPNRGAHQALRRASEYVRDGKVWVVDIDLEKYFDRVNHDILMSRIARKVRDKKSSLKSLVCRARLV